MSGFRCQALFVFRPKERKLSVNIACLVVVLFTFLFKIIFIYFCVYVYTHIHIMVCLWKELNLYRVNPSIELRFSDLAAYTPTH